MSYCGVHLLLARTGILTVALLAGDIGQSGLVPGREQMNSSMDMIIFTRGHNLRIRAKRGAPLPTRYGDFIPLGRPAGGGRGSPKKFPEKFSDNGVRDKHHRVSDVSVTSFSYILSRSGTCVPRNTCASLHPRCYASPHRHFDAR